MIFYEGQEKNFLIVCWALVWLTWFDDCSFL